MIKAYTEGHAISYKYNGDGLRMSKNVNGTLTYHVWDGQNMVIEMNGSGTTTSKYIRGINLISGKDAAGTVQYYLFNGHGDVTSLTDSAGNVKKNYTYEAFGNEKNPDPNDTNVFRYTGEYFDKETGTIYLRARYYAPRMGRFVTEDPVESGDNWYTYCANNPIEFLDPFGLEQIVVSGGAYSDVSVHPGYKYNFIEPAIKKLNELRSANDSETITWVIAMDGYSYDDYLHFNESVKNLNVTVKAIYCKEDLIKYVNEKDGDNRASDKITNYVVFSHGFANGTISLAYNYNDANYNKDFDFTKDDIARVSGAAFDNPNSWFYSCNTGTGDNSFAKMWNSQVGGFTGAYAGKTEYSYIIYPKGYSSWNPKYWGVRNQIKGLRKGYGFSASGSFNYPEAASGVRQVTFRR